MLSLIISMYMYSTGIIATNETPSPLPHLTCKVIVVTHLQLMCVYSVHINKCTVGIDYELRVKKILLWQPYLNIDIHVHVILCMHACTYIGV